MKLSGYIILLLLVFSPCLESESSQATGMASGTVHPGQVLRSILSFLSPAFGRSNFHRQVPTRPPRRESS